MSFSLTRKTDYALVALARLAQQTEAGGSPLSARAIGEEYGLPLPLLMNVLKDLNRAGLIASRRGAGGGYFLDRSARDICLADVVGAIEGPVSVAMCCEREGEQGDRHEPCLGCRLTEACPITGNMRQLNDVIVSVLHRMSLADLMRGDVSVTIRIDRGAAAARAPKRPAAPKPVVTPEVTLHSLPQTSAR